MAKRRRDAVLLWVLPFVDGVMRLREAAGVLLVALLFVWGTKKRPYTAEGENLPLFYFQEDNHMNYSIKHITTVQELDAALALDEKYSASRVRTLVPHTPAKNGWSAWRITLI